MTVEEIEIIVTAEVTKALSELKKLQPEISSIMSGIQNKVNSLNMQKISSEAKKASKAVQETFDPDDTSFKITIDGKDFDEYEKNLKKISAEVTDTVDTIQDKIGKNVGFKQYDSASIEDFMQKFDSAEGKDLDEKLKNMNENTSNNSSDSETSDSSTNSEISMLEKLKSKIEQVKQKFESLNKTKEKSNLHTIFQKTQQAISGTLPKLQSFMGKVTGLNKTSGVTSSFKTGLKDVLKYAGALFSLRSVYSTLKNLGSNWLNSNSAEAKQASANLDYMKNVLSSGLAPVMQTLINFAYQFLKAIQSVVFAVTKVNIFAKSTASSLKSASGSASKTSKSLSSVHSEINNVSTSSGGSGSVSPNMDLSSVDNVQNSIIDAISNGNWTMVGELIGEKLNSALSSIPWTTIQNTAKGISTNIASLLNGFIGGTDWNLVGNTIAQGLNTAVYTAQAFVTNFDFSGFGTALGNTLNGFFENADWGAMANTISAKFIGIMDFVSSAIATFDPQVLFDALVEFIENIDWNGLIDSAIQLIGTAMADALKLGMIIGQWINDAIISAKEYFKKYAEIAGGDMGVGILLGVANALKNLGDWIREHIFQPFIDGFKNVFGIHSPSTVMAEMGSYLMQGLLNGISGLVERVSEIWNDIKTRVRDGAQGAWDAITGIFGNVKEWFQSKFSEAWDAVKNVFSSGGAVFEGIKDGIASVFTTIVNKLIDGINRVVAIPFNAINKALNKIKSVSIAGIQPFNNLFSTISVPQLPRLATGNVAYKETVAVFGEYANARSNPEITAPQNVMRDVFEDTLSNFQFQNSNNSNSGLKTLVIRFGSMEVAIEMDKLITEARRQNGVATITV